MPIEIMVEPDEPVRVKPEAIEPKPVSPPAAGFAQADLPNTVANIGLLGSGLLAVLALLKLLPRLRALRLLTRLA